MKRQLFISSSYYAHQYVTEDPGAYYSDPKLYIEAQKWFQEHFPTDIIAGPIYLAGEAYQYGTTTQIQKETGPIIKDYAYEASGCVEDKEPSLDDPYYDYVFRSFEGMRKAFPEKMLAAMLVSPLDYGIMVFGLQRWVEMFLFEKSLFFDWLSRFTCYHNRYKEALLGCGANIIAVTNMMLNNRIVSDHMINADLIPFLNKHLDAEMPTLVHSTFMPIRESLKHLEKLDTTMGYVVNASDDLSAIPEHLVSEKLLLGNLGSDFIYKKTPEALERMTYEALTAMDAYPQFVLGTTGADLNLRTTEVQLKSIYKGMERYEKERTRL